jgi:hypothetical protein
VADLLIAGVRKPAQHRTCCLNTWESDFLASVAENKRGLSQKQNAALIRITGKVARCARGRA